MIKRRTTGLVMGFAVLMTAGAIAGTSQLTSAAAPSGAGTADGQVKQASPKPTKSAQATPPPKGLSVGGELSVSGLAPGLSVSRTLHIENPNNQDVELQSVKTELSGPSPTPTTGTCSWPDDFEVIVAGYSTTTGIGTPVTIGKNSSLRVPVTVRMNNRNVNQDSCKGKSWTFTFTATATSK